MLHIASVCTPCSYCCVLLPILSGVVGQQWWVRLHLVLGYLLTVPVEFLTGWKIWLDTSFTRNRSIFSRCSHGTVEPGWTLTFVRGFTICPCAEPYLSKSKMASPSWVTTHPCNRVFTVQKFSRPRSSYLDVQIFDHTGQKFDLDFSVQIFVRFAWFRVNGTPKRRNFRPVKKFDRYRLNIALVYYFFAILVAVAVAVVVV